MTFCGDGSGDRLISVHVQLAIICTNVATHGVLVLYYIAKADRDRDAYANTWPGIGEQPAGTVCHARDRRMVF